MKAEENQIDNELERIQESDILKQEGTVYFKKGQWAQALVTYQSALGKLPKRRPPPAATAPFKDGNDQGGSVSGGAVPPVDDEHIDAVSSDVYKGKQKQQQQGEEEQDGPPPPTLTGVERQYAKARAVLNANIGACHVHLGEHKQAVEACSEALVDDPDYVKALHRRASSNEHIGTWSSLSSAEEDYKALLNLVPADSPLVRQVNQALVTLRPRVEVAQKKETAEMLGKLKGLGNNILGKFGLSTENFQFEPNGQGGYSVNFKQ